MPRNDSKRLSKIMQASKPVSVRLDGTVRFVYEAPVNFKCAFLDVNEVVDLSLIVLDNAVPELGSLSSALGSLSGVLTTKEDVAIAIGAWLQAANINTYRVTLTSSVKPNAIVTVEFGDLTLE